MTDTHISEQITPSDEILRDDGTIDSTGLLDEVSLYNLYDDRSSPEQDADRILKITYPTDTLKTIIRNTAQNLNGDSNFSEGGQVIGGGYGSGKSHIELVIYHLFNSPSLGQAWLDSKDIEVDLPSETQTAALQMFNLDKEYDRLSEAIADYLGIDGWKGDNDLPTVHQIRDTLEGEPALVLLDIDKIQYLYHLYKTDQNTVEYLKEWKTEELEDLADFMGGVTGDERYEDVMDMGISQF